MFVCRSFCGENMFNYFLFLFLVTNNLKFLTAQQDPCSTFCGREPASIQNVARGNPGPPGKQGPQGEPGKALQCDCSITEGGVCDQIQRLKTQVEAVQGFLNGSSDIALSCQQIKDRFPESKSGLHKIKDLNGHEYSVYCDMNTDGGGWTLVSSIHENNIGQGDQGKCTVGDKWSSEQGNSPGRVNGDGNWQNRNIFGFVTAATSDDYKNPAYFELEARDLMIWQVPNETPLRDFLTSAYLRYRTNNGFLAQYGGNLYHLYNEHYPITSEAYNFPGDSGPAIPVVFDQGDSVSLLQHFPPNAKPLIEPGYIQFRAISTHRDAFALCPGIRNKPTFNSPSQSCLGSAGKTHSNTYCGDFSGLVHNGFAIGTGWSADETMISTSFLLLYR